MSKFRFVIAETQSYEICVDAKDIDKAMDYALENYGSEGEIIHTDATLIDYEEDEE